MFFFFIAGFRSEAGSLYVDSNVRALDKLNHMSAYGAHSMRNVITDEVIS